MLTESLAGCTLNELFFLAVRIELFGAVTDTALILARGPCILVLRLL